MRATSDSGGGISCSHLSKSGRLLGSVVHTIDGHSRYHGVLTIHEVTASARFAHAVFATEEPDTNPLADSPLGHAGADGIYAANNFMSRHARQCQSSVGTGDRRGIGVTDSACVHPNPHLTGPRLDECPLNDLQGAGG
jgi:hypothetical protein